MSRATRPPAYERRDAPALAIVYGLAGLFGVIAIAAAVVAGLFAFWGKPIPTMAPRTAMTKDVPRLEIKEGEDRSSLEAVALARLKGYAWIDRDAGVVRIPIERAVDLQVQQGWKN